jgi:uncharacterized protein DUF2784
MLNPYRIAADFVLIVHMAFVVFVVLGGTIVVRWPRVAWAHVPAAIWGALIEFAGWICPLTPIENELRRRAGLEPYQGDFVEQYILPLLYPSHLTRSTQLALGALVVAINAAAYWHAVRRSKRDRR